MAVERRLRLENPRALADVVVEEFDVLRISDLAGKNTSTHSGSLVLPLKSTMANSEASLTLDEKDRGARDTAVALERVELEHSLLAYCDIVKVASCVQCHIRGRKYLRHEHDSSGEEGGAEEEGKGGDEDRQEVVAPLHIPCRNGSAHHRRRVRSGAKT